MANRSSGRAFILLSCGHSHRRRKFAATSADLLQCPHCGEFGEVVCQTSEAKPLRQSDDDGTLVLFDNPAELEAPPF